MIRTGTIEKFKIRGEHLEQARGVVVPSIDWFDSCDYCDCQEAGGHYCLLHSRQMKNMHTLRCSDWEPKQD